MSVQQVKQTILFIVLMATAAPAWAYLDPSTGSMVISAIVGLFASLTTK